MILETKELASTADIVQTSKGDSGVTPTDRSLGAEYVMNIKQNEGAR